MTAQDRVARQARQAALADARAAGSTCQPEIDITHTGAGPSLIACTMRHDPWCGLLRAMEGGGPGFQRVATFDLGEAER